MCDILCDHRSTPLRSPSLRTWAWMRLAGSSCCFSDPHCHWAAPGQCLAMAEAQWLGQLDPKLDSYRKAIFIFLGFPSVWTSLSQGCTHSKYCESHPPPFLLSLLLTQLIIAFETRPVPSPFYVWQAFPAHKLLITLLILSYCLYLRGHNLMHSVTTLFILMLKLSHI